MARASAGICLGHLEELLLEQRKKFGEAVKGDLARKEDRPTIAKLTQVAELMYATSDLSPPLPCLVLTKGSTHASQLRRQGRLAYGDFASSSSVSVPV